MNEDNAAASVDFAYFVDMCLRVVGEIKQHGDEW
jgi:hypothetical protein